MIFSSKNVISKVAQVCYCEGLNCRGFIGGEKQTPLKNTIERIATPPTSSPRRRQRKKRNLTDDFDDITVSHFRKNARLSECLSEVLLSKTNVSWYCNAYTGYVGGLVDEIPYFLEFWRDHWVSGLWISIKWWKAVVLKKLLFSM